MINKHYSDTSHPNTIHAPVNIDQNQANDGMSLRDYFAGQVLVGIMSHDVVHAVIKEDTVRFPSPQLYGTVVKRCYTIADAMLVERKK